MSVATHLFLTRLPSSRFLSFKARNLFPPIPYHHPTTVPLNSCSFRFPPHDTRTLFTLATLKPHQHTICPLKSNQSHHIVLTRDPSSLPLDSLLSLAELLCIISSAIIMLTYVLSCSALRAKKTLFGFIWSGSKEVLVWGVVVVSCGMAVGAWIRRRQWQRICGVAVRSGEGGRESANLVERVEKLEEDLKNSATIIQVLSRQLEKLGIRFRVTRKALKQPIDEAAALAQKNSEAAQALAVQEDILEKELGEIQKVLLSMQEQQLKQLELILAIGKTGKLWENRREPSKEPDVIKTSQLTEVVKQLDTQETQPSAAGKGNKNDRA